MKENNRPMMANDSVPEEAHSDGQSTSVDIPGDLDGALDHLEPGKPLILNDGLLIADSGYLLSSQYVDIGLTKRSRRPRVLVKAIEAEYGIEYASSLQISAPHRYRDYGETFIQDDQEGRAQRFNATEREPRSYEESTREQERALALLGKTGVTITETEMPSSQTDSERLDFGGRSWIFCTSIVPCPDKRDEWRASLPRKYNHESVIRQPGKFALALAAMFADQTGPQERASCKTGESSGFIA